MADTDQADWAELANVLHEDWCGCDSWDGTNCEDYHEAEFHEQTNAVLMAGWRKTLPDTSELDELRAAVEAAIELLDTAPLDPLIERVGRVLRGEEDA
jgi:hypothetical protein